jgi:hypothetical protein
MATWELVPRQGIRTTGVDLVLGMDRAAARAALGGETSAGETSAGLAGPVSHFPGEDDYTDADTWIRLHYDDGTLRAIELLRGDLRLDGIALHGGAYRPALEESLAAKGFRFESAGAYGEGRECASLGVNIATHEDAGGDGDGVEWVIVSSDIE